jgi:plasmid stabilization system protein ParE
MTYRYVFDPVALSEYKEAVSWYQERSQRVAENFVAELQTMIREICNDPLRYRSSYKKYRETALRKYPFTNFFLVDQTAQKVVISSVFHHKRSPRKKYRKK